MTDSSPEARLFQAVVVLALTDACTPVRVTPYFRRTIVPGAKTKRKGRKAKVATVLRPKSLEEWKRENRALLRAPKLDRDEARTWLLRAGRDFHSVCGYAGFDPAYVRENAQALAADGWKSRDKNLVTVGRSLAYAA